jgi:hypothetical protein
MKRIALIATLALVSTLGAAAQQRQGQNGQFCLVTRDGAINCGFATLAQCEQARKGTTHEPCTRNPQAVGRPARPASPSPSR